MNLIRRCFSGSVAIILLQVAVRPKSLACPPQNIPNSKNGEYAFAVGVDGEVRFVRNTDASSSLWSQLPHTLLFPLDSILTAGSFVIERDSIPHITRVNICSDIFFYDQTSRADMRQQSDRFLTTLGHFFQALDRLGIPYHEVLISKF